MRHHARVNHLERHVQRLSVTLSELRKELSSGGQHGKPGHTCDHAERVAGYLALGSARHEGVFEELVSCGMRLVNAQGGALTLLERKTGRLVYRTVIGKGGSKAGRPVPLRGDPHGLAFATGEVHSVAHESAEGRKTTAFFSVLVAPLALGGDSFGTLGAINKQGADHFDARDMEKFKRFADLAALIVHQHVRENMLRAGLAGDKSPGKSFSMSFGREDRELLELFEALAQLRRAQPEVMGTVRRFIKNLSEP